MSVESPIAHEPILPDSLRADLRDNGYSQEIADFRALIFSETREDGSIVDHMLILDKKNPHVAAGIFQLKRHKAKSLKNIEAQDSINIDPDESLIGNDIQLGEKIQEYNSLNYVRENMNTFFFKGPDASIHAVVLDESDKLMHLYIVNPKKGLSAAEYFRNFSPDETAFERMAEVYDNPEEGFHP